MLMVMNMAKRELKARVMVIMKNGETKAFDELTADEKNSLLSGISKRVSDTMSCYFSNHINEYKQFVS